MNQITKEFDTITAIATPLGEGAIGIVHLSGTEALAIANRVFQGKKFRSGCQPYSHLWAYH